jgi:hypothetical protein
LFALGVSAAVYRWQGPDGQTVFSDRPQEGAEEIEVRPLQTVPAYPVSRGVSPGGGESPDADGGSYLSFEILSPAADASIRDNAGNVEISLLLEPALQVDHIIRFLLDGQPFGEGVTASAVTLANVDRGSHNLTAIITTAAGEEIARTDPVTFHLHRVSKLLTPPRPAPLSGQ